MTTTVEASPIESALYHLNRSLTHLGDARVLMGEDYTERLAILEANTESLIARAETVVREVQKEGV